MTKMVECLHTWRWRRIRCSNSIER